MQVAQCRSLAEKSGVAYVPLYTQLKRKMSQPSSLDDSLSVQLGIVSSDSEDSSSSDQNQYLAAIRQPSPS